MTKREKSIIIQGNLNIILSTSDRANRQKEVIRDTEYFDNTV